MTKLRPTVTCAIAVSLALAFHNAFCSGGSWTSLGLDGIYSGQRIAFHSATPRLVYATDAAGNLLKATDGGGHWAPVAIPGHPPALCCGTLVVDPSTSTTVYIEMGGTLYRSVDYGAHWTAAGTFPWLGALAIANSQPSTLYAAGPGVWRSVDAGQSWRPANDGLPREAAIWTLAVDPKSADIAYAATFDSKMFKSTDAGAHWRQVPMPLATGTMVTRLAIDSNVPSTLYAAYAGNWDPHPPGVLKSTDRGETWVPVLGMASGKWINSLAIDPADPRRVYVATSEGVVMSADGAAHWSPLNDGLPTVFTFDVAIDQTGTVLRAATARGLFEYRLASSGGDRAQPVVEYHHAGFDHYFMTNVADEIEKLDGGAFEGWTSTGLQFNASVSGTATSPVCRFFSTAFAPKSSHFYSPFDAECTKVRGDAHWQLETSDAFDITVPSATGTCASGLVPVYRLYNDGRGGAPNHRYTTDQAVRSQMIAQGWVPEGLGREAVQMCAPL